MKVTTKLMPRTRESLTVQIDELMAHNKALYSAAGRITQEAVLNERKMYLLKIQRKKLDEKTQDVEFVVSRGVATELKICDYCTSPIEEDDPYWESDVFTTGCCPDHAMEAAHAKTTSMS